MLLLSGSLWRGTGPSVWTWRRVRSLIYATSWKAIVMELVTTPHQLPSFVKGVIFTFSWQKHTHLPQGNFIQTKIIWISLCLRDHHHFILLCMKLLSIHLSLAHAGGTGAMVLGAQGRPLRNLLFRLIDTDMPDSIQQVSGLFFLKYSYSDSRFNTAVGLCWCWFINQNIMELTKNPINLRFSSFLVEFNHKSVSWNILAWIFIPCQEQGLHSKTRLIFLPVPFSSNSVLIYILLYFC